MTRSKRKKKEEEERDLIFFKMIFFSRRKRRELNKVNALILLLLQMFSFFLQILSFFLSFIQSLSFFSKQNQQTYRSIREKEVERFWLLILGYFKWKPETVWRTACGLICLRFDFWIRFALNVSKLSKL